MLQISNETSNRRHAISSFTTKVIYRFWRFWKITITRCRQQTSNQMSTTQSALNQFTRVNKSNNKKLVGN